MAASSILPRMARTPTGAVGLFVLGATALVALMAPWIVPFDPLQTQLSATTILQPPSAEHLFGTDNLGRDILSRSLHGARLSIALALAAVAIGVSVGALIGATAAMLGGWWERIAMRAMDALLAFPVLVLAIAIAVVVGRGPSGVIFAVALVNVPIFGRLARAQALQINALPYMAATEVLGFGFKRRLFRHLLPNIVNPIVVQASVCLSFAVLIEAGLSFLGLGIQAPRPSLGLMIAEAKAYMALAPHMVLFPSLVLVLIVIGFNLIGDALAQATDPKVSA